MRSVILGGVDWRLDYLLIDVVVEGSERCFEREKGGYISSHL